MPTFLFQENPAKATYSGITMKNKSHTGSFNADVQWMLILLSLLFFCSCASFFKTEAIDLSQILNTYQSQKKIKAQGLKMVPTPFGPKPSIYFGYDRNNDEIKMRQAQKGNGVDLIEFKRLLPDGGWERSAFLIFSDDDFDGIADRIFLDSDFDGEMDVERMIKAKAIRMDRIEFNRIEF
jgi:hypothetical protein